MRNIKKWANEKGLDYLELASGRIRVYLNKDIYMTIRREASTSGTDWRGNSYGNPKGYMMNFDSQTKDIFRKSMHYYTQKEIILEAEEMI